MTLNLIQISNIFNMIAQKHDAIKFYHFGWHEDINININNNFDIDNQSGVKYPAVYLYPPGGEIERVSGRTYFDIELDFFNLADYNNDSTTNNNSLLEQWEQLRTWADEYINEIKHFKYNGKTLFGIVDNKLSFDYDSNYSNNRLIKYGVKFKLVTFGKCQLDSLFVWSETELEQATGLTDLENYCK